MFRLDRLFPPSASRTPRRGQTRAGGRAIPGARDAQTRPARASRFAPRGRSVPEIVKRSVSLVWAISQWNVINGKYSPHQFLPDPE
jgi:hypothetical protein